MKINFLATVLSATTSCIALVPAAAQLSSKSECLTPWCG